MDIPTWTLIALAFFSLIYYYFKSKLSYFENRGIPYLPGWPILGNMADAILRRKHILKVLEDIYNVDRRAKYVGAFEFMSPVIVLRDLELIKAVAIKNFDSFPDHKTHVDSTVDPYFGNNLFNLKGHQWRETRNLVSPTFTLSKMKGMFELMVYCGKTLTSHLATVNEEKLKMTDTKDLFTRFANDVIATCAFGINIDSLNNPDNDFYKLGRKVTNLEGALMVKFFMARVAPSLMKFLKIKFIDEKIADYFKTIVSETINMRKTYNINRPDLIQIMMEAQDKNWDVVKITSQAFIFFFGGFESTSSQMCILAHELAINAEVQSRLQEEIDEVIEKTGGKLTYEALNEMAYLDAVFNESLRQHPQAGFLDRLCVKAFELPPTLPGAKPFTVQPGMNVWIPASAIYKDPDYYENPEKFDPERYYQKKITINDAANLGFGIGPRGCIGNRFAILQTKMLFFYLLSKFNLRPNAKTSVPFEYSKKVFTIRPEEGFWLSIEPRS